MNTGCAISVFEIPPAPELEGWRFTPVWTAWVLWLCDRYGAGGVWWGAKGVLWFLPQERMA